MAVLSEGKERRNTLVALLKFKMQNAKCKITTQNLKFTKSKLIVIVGPTSSGKSGLAVRLAKKFDGEIISADSRQVYKGMDIGTGKITKQEMHGIPHHLLSIASPKRRFTVVQYRKKALAEIKKILRKGKTPFLVGGTGFYIQAVIDGLLLPEVPPDWRLRRRLGKKSAEELFGMLKKLDPSRAKTIERKNKRRLIRGLEIVLKTKKPVPSLRKAPPPYDVLLIGIKKSKTELRRAIKKRLIKRLKSGMLKEVQKLRRSGLSWKRLEEFGLEYKYCALHLQGGLSWRQMVEKLQKEIERYARRQMTWFKKDKRIHWIANYKMAEELVHNFIKS